MQRRIALVTPHFVAALAAVADTDLVTTLSAALARRFADGFGLVLRPAPLPDARLPLTLVGSRVHAADPVLRWFAELVRSVGDGCFAAHDCSASALPRNPVLF